MTDEIRRDLLETARPRGPTARCLEIGPWSLRLEGLDPSLATELEGRFGGFLAPEPSRAERLVAHVVAGSSACYLDGWAEGGVYGIEAAIGSDGLLVRSHHFALAPETAEVWRIGLAGGAGTVEPIGRVVENALRYLVTRLAFEDGGVALHGAAVERDGRAYVLAGPSRSGKTTAVGLLAPARSLGDDFAVVLPTDSGWLVPAVPFDNAERPPAGSAGSPRDVFPLAGVFRLLKARQARLETPSAPLAIASLLACAAFPWALPDLAEAIAEQVERLATEAPFAYLHFAPDSDLWPLLLGGTS